ncbi:MULTISPECIES: hypothetical protein [unclassified Kitasatospora]|uniref:hypothetical protein n=1 Tax=unclassified Kitasatospora TaxID=2633591 RepID=UPI0024758939|nr:hypothetical protein [Kitasatospora sp. MAP12-44]
MIETRHPHGDLVAHLTRTTPLGPGAAARAISEVLSYFSEPVDVYVRRRHRELQRTGLTNDAIFEVIGRELPHRRVTAAELSARQMRRMIYG